MKREVVEAEVVVVLEVAEEVGLGETVEMTAEVEVEAGVVPATIVAKKDIWQGIAIEKEETVERGEEGLVEAEVAVAEGEAATIVGEMVTWLGNAPRGNAMIEDSFVINSNKFCTAL